MKTTRNEILSTMTLAAGLLLTGTAARQAQAQTATTLPSDLDVLNFALNLEYLEAEFYSYAVNGTGIDASLTGGTGTAGATTGGAKVNFADATVAAIAAEIAQDELNHVRFLRSALGAQAVAKPAINLAALGTGFANDTEFLTVSRALEDVGVSAYAGGARFFQNRDLFEAAGRILGTEAFHAGNIRHLLLRKGITSVPQVDAKDIPPTTNKQFATIPTTGLAVARTTAEVLAIVRGPNALGGAFFPAGLNGTIR